MQSTLLLIVPNTPARRGIAQDFAAGAAIRAGLPPLAADRAGRDVGALVDSAGADEVTIEAQLSAAGLRLRLTAAPHWPSQAALLPAAIGGRREGDSLVLELRRAPLRPA